MFQKKIFPPSRLSMACLVYDSLSYINLPKILFVFLLSKLNNKAKKSTNKQVSYCFYSKTQTLNANNF